MTKTRNTGTSKPVLSLAERQRRKRRRNRILILLSPLIVLLSPILLPVFFVVRHYKNKSSRKVSRRMGEIAGDLASVEPPKRNDAEEAWVDAKPDTFALCRVIGNDLVPRHRAGQSLQNVAFILEHEPELKDCTKLWILNRIVDPKNEAELIALLERHNQKYERIAFDPAELQSIGYDFSTFDDPMIFANGMVDGLDDDTRGKMVTQAYRARNNYVMNNNGARNQALEFCLKHAKWALPFDGNCFFTNSAWEVLRKDITSQRDKRYFCVPMARMQDNEELLRDASTPEAVEEPQMAFRCDAPLRFDEAHHYGRRPKVELFLHLGIPGIWQNFPVEEFDLPPRKVSAEGHRVGHAGWVARLFSGQAQLEHKGVQTLKNRGLARNEAICATLDMLEARHMQDTTIDDATLFFDSARIEALAGSMADADLVAVVAAADEALTRGPFSVTDKPEPGPSGDLHDYYHPSPYWWPDPKKKSGRPYVFRDGQRVPGTQLYEEESDRFDRTRLQRLFDDSTALALAAKLTGDTRYRDHLSRLIKTWFVDVDTRLNPNLDYAQVRLGHKGDKGLAHGLIETKDFYFFLDAVRMLGNTELSQGVRQWCAAFLEWLTDSEQGKGERRAKNNHGTCYDLQAASLAAFLGDTTALQRINLRAQARVLGTITEDGEQPHEMTRTLTQHYCAFNLQSWINLFNLLEGAGLRPWSSDAAERLVVAMRQLLSESVEGWKHEQIEPFEVARLVPIDVTLRQQTGQGILQSTEAPACFYPHDGIPPFWRLARGYGGPL